MDWQAPPLSTLKSVSTLHLSELQRRSSALVVTYLPSAVSRLMVPVWQSVVTASVAKPTRSLWQPRRYCFRPLFPDSPTVTQFRFVIISGVVLQ